MFKKLSIFTIYFTFFLDNMGLGIIYPIFTPLFLNPGYQFFVHNPSMLQRTLYLGLLISFFPLAQFFGAPLIGELSDRYGRKKGFTITILGSAIGYVLIGLSIEYHSFPLLLLSRLTTGFFAGNLTICLASLVDMSKDERDRTKKFGQLASIGGLSFLLAIAMGGIFSNPELNIHFKPSLPFWITAALFLFNLLFMLISFKECHKVVSRGKFTLLQGVHNIASALKIRPLRKAYGVYFFFMVGWVACMQFLPTYLYKQYEISTDTLTSTFIAIGLTWGIVNLLLNRFFSRLFTSSLTLLWSLGILALALTFLLIPESLSAFLFHFMFTVALSALCWTNALSNVSIQAPIETQGRILGINQSFGAIASLLGPLTGALLSAFDPTVIFLFSSICALAAFLLIANTYPFRKQAKS